MKLIDLAGETVREGTADEILADLGRRFPPGADLPDYTRVMCDYVGVKCDLQAVVRGLYADRGIETKSLSQLQWARDRQEREDILRHGTEDEKRRYLDGVARERSH